MDYAIIAAGEGSRLAREGIAQPKPLVKLHGVPLVDRLIRIFLDNGASSLSIIVNEEMEEVHRHLQALHLPVPFHLIRRTTPASMHSFFHLRQCLSSERFCLTTVDTIFKEEEFSAYIRAFQADDSDGLMAVTDYIDDEKPLYVNTGEDLMIQSFTDEAQAGSRYVSGGMYCLKRRPAITLLEEAFAQGCQRMRNYQRCLLTAGLRLRAFPFSKIIDVDHAADIAKANQLLMLND